jgi:hypothetical protein
MSAQINPTTPGDSMDNGRTFNRASLWLTWVVANYVGLGLGFAAGYAVGSAVYTAICNGTPGPDSYLPCYARLGLPRYIEAVGTIIGASVGGIIIGVAQWWALKRYAPCKNWIGLSVLGWILGLILGTILTGALTYLGVSSTNIAYYAGIGLGVGFAQWFSLRAWSPQAAVWIPINGLVVMFAGALSDHSGGDLSAVALFGPLTGLALVWLLRATHPASIPSNESTQ